MYHYTYKITSSGLYYVGRHSTHKLNDNYMGSGTWIKKIRNKISLKKEILDFFDNEEDLIEAERSLLNENINNDLCMNFNNNPAGFASGERNPAKTREERIKRSARIKNDPDHPLRNCDIRKSNSNKQRGRVAPNKGIAHTPETRQKISSSRTGIKISDEGREKLSISRKKQILSGERILPSFAGKNHTMEYKEHMRELSVNRNNKTCPHCGVTCKPHVYARWHGDKCKHIITRDRLEESGRVSPL